MNRPMRQTVTTAAQVGEILRSRRKSRRAGQAALAEKLGISQSRLSILEANPAGFTLDRLLALAKLLGLEVVLQDAPERRPKVEW
jgi:HTH-type transcriptional regulator/antitoxin HipB